MWCATVVYFTFTVILADFLPAFTVMTAFPFLRAFTFTVIFLAAFVVFLTATAFFLEEVTIILSVVFFAAVVLVTLKVSVAVLFLRIGQKGNACFILTVNNR